MTYYCYFPEKETSSAVADSEMLTVYPSPELAALLVPEYLWGRKLWEVKGTSEYDFKTLLKCSEVVPLRPVMLPIAYPKQKARFAISYIWLAGPCNSQWKSWASRWLSGEDTSAKAAKKAAHLADRLRKTPTSVGCHYAAEAARTNAEGYWNKVGWMAGMAIVSVEGFVSETTEKIVELAREALEER